MFISQCFIQSLKYVNYLNISKKILSKNLQNNCFIHHYSLRSYSLNRDKLYNSNLKKLQKTLEDVSLSQLLSLKEAVSLCSEIYEYDLVESELLSLYRNYYPQILKNSENNFRNLSSNLVEMQSSLFSGGIHKMSDCPKIILQVGSGVGGEESARFASELFTMYKNICLDRNFKFVKHFENSAEITGGTDFFKYEFGVHRVQRIPFNSKRMQTSSAVVTVVPHFDIQNTKLKVSDLHIETMRSSGPGGQSVNKSETAVRVVHIPTGISTSIRDTSSQIDNKSIALEVISKKIREKQEKELEMIKSELKSSQIKTGDRSEKIRTFNFIHDTIIDHRCKVKVNGVEPFLENGTGVDKIHQALSDLEDSMIVNFMIENMDLFVEFCKNAHKLK